jgi:dTDP-glucose 4,6-dehydratase
VNNRILITGGAGFIGSHVVQHLLELGLHELTVLDRLDSAGNLNRLAEIGAVNNPRVRFQYHDLRAPISDMLARQLGTFEHIIHLAAGTHVDRSIADPLSFVYDNVVGTCNLLEFARKTGCHRFLNFSTDEVFGAAPPGVLFHEDDRYRSCNPYSASKAGAEELGIAYHNTYGVPVMTTHCMNVIGIRQHPEKFVPNTIAKVRDGQTVQIHADKTCKISGSRFFIGADQVADAVVFLLGFGAPGHKYNIVGERELTNLQVAKIIARQIGRTLDYEMIDGHTVRPGMDLRYAMSGDKMRRMGWSPKQTIEDTIRDITRWSLENPHWLPQEIK